LRRKACPWLVFTHPPSPSLLLTAPAVSRVTKVDSRSLTWGIHRPQSPFVTLLLSPPPHLPSSANPSSHQMACARVAAFPSPANCLLYVHTSNIHCLIPHLPPFDHKLDVFTASLAVHVEDFKYSPASAVLSYCYRAALLPLRTLASRTLVTFSYHSNRTDTL
jgi:hypothetical protein